MGRNAGTFRLSRRHSGKSLAVKAGCFMLGFVIVLVFSDKARTAFLGESDVGVFPNSVHRQLQINEYNINMSTLQPFDPTANSCNLTWALDVWAYEDYYQRAWFACVVYISAILFIFLGIAVVCDDFFCTSLEVICEKLNLSEQVAGATFMAAGSSAPELATSLVTVFTSRNSTGLGTILGSAVFNLVMIVAMSGIFGNGPQGRVHRACETASVEAGGPDKLPQGLFLDWRPLVRDASFYVVSLVICVIFALTTVTGDYADNAEVACKPGYNWWEGLILVLLYGFYILVMIKNDAFMDCLKKCGGMPAHIDSYLQYNIRKKIAAQHKLDDAYVPQNTVEQAKKDPSTNNVNRLDTISKQQLNMVLVEEESMSPKKLGHRIHGAFTATNEGSKYQNLSNSEDGTQTEQAIVEEDMIELTAVDGDKNTPKGDQDPNTQDLAADPVVSGNNSDNEANDTEDAAESTELTGHRHLMKLVENDKVLSDEHVALIARQVVGLREHMVGLQDRLVPLFHLTTADFKLDQDALKDEENKSCCSKCCGSFMNVLSWPWRCIFKITIPECDRDSYQKWEETAVVYTDIPDGERRKLQLDEEDDNIDLNQTHWFRGKYSKQKVDTWYARSQLYWISFVMSIVWIWLTSWGMVDFAQHLGCLINIGPYIMGLVVLAAGTSIPDTLSSIMVARDGFGDMAVANAIGSNVFNIFLGIGLPMLLTEFAWGEPFITSGTDPAAVLLAGVMLILITIFMIVILVAAKWVLSKPLAGFLMIFFVVYLVLSIVFEAEQQIAYDPIMEWLAYSC